jgi:hypothetical protein
MVVTILRAVVGAIIAVAVAALAFVGIKLAARPARRCEPPEETRGGLHPGCFSNPWACVDSQVMVDSPIGVPAVYPQCGKGPNTVVRSQAGFTGLDAGAQTILGFRPSANVSVDVVHFSSEPAPGMVEYAQGGAIVGVRPLLPTPGVLQRYAWTGSGIDRIVVRPMSPSFVTLVIIWCH